MLYDLPRGNRIEFLSPTLNGETSDHISIDQTWGGLTKLASTPWCRFKIQMDLKCWRVKSICVNFYFYWHPWLFFLSWECFELMELRVRSMVVNLMKVWMFMKLFKTFSSVCDILDSKHSNVLVFVSRNLDLYSLYSQLVLKYKYTSPIINKRRQRIWISISTTNQLYNTY